MTILFLLGRIIVGGFFLMNALNHFTQVGAMSGYAKMKGVPLPTLEILGTGLLMGLGGLSILVGYMPTFGVALLVIFLLPTSLMMHNFWTIEDPMARMGDQINFMKNMALVGALLMFLAIPQPWPFSLGG